MKKILNSIFVLTVFLFDPFSSFCQITGTGAINYLPKFTSLTNLTNSQIYDNGTKVGIGTGTNPLFKLDVNGADASGAVAAFRNGTYQVFIATKLSAGWNYNQLTQQNDNGIFWSDYLAPGPRNLSSGFVLAPHHGSTNGIRIDANGNIGVGVSAPLGKMQLGYYRTMVFGEASGNGVYGEYIGFNAVLNTSVVPNIFTKLTSNSGAGGGSQRGGAVIVTDYNGNISFQMFDAGGGYEYAGTTTNYKPQVVFQNNGNVNVCGTIKSKSVIVQTGWCDYVFKKDYELMPLSLLEQYIIANSHLPEIPTEEEIEQNGVSLGEMQKLQMKKIEELTLYIIQQNKIIDSLKNTIELKTKN